MARERLGTAFQRRFSARPHSRRPGGWPVVEVTLVGLRWEHPQGYDVHLLPGLASPRFATLLLADVRDPVTGEVDIHRPALVPGLTLTFSAAFLGPVPGITMDPVTGEVAVTSAVAAEWFGRSFEVTATAALGPDTSTIRIRVYIHSAITKVWLTPWHLTLRPEAFVPRFTVLAQFDDGAIGDIGNWGPFWSVHNPGDDHVRTIGTNASLLSWSVPPDAPVSVLPDSGGLTVIHPSGEALVTVSVAGRTASAMVTCTTAWTPRRVRQVVAWGTLAEVAGPGVAGMKEVPNVLFLPDGFTDNEEEIFEKLVRRLVARLTTRHWTRPFRHLRVNYWMAWVASPEAGVSVLHEVSRRLSPTSSRAEAVYPVELPSAETPAGTWELRDMIHEVGLPRPLTDPLHLPLDNELLHEWRSLYGAHITRQQVQHLYDEWLVRGTRVLLNERDTAFHMAYGERPRLAAGRPDDELRSHLRRDATFEVFLGALRGPRDEELPNVWGIGRKDRDLVVMLCRSQRAGARHTTADTMEIDPLGVSLDGVEFHLAMAEPGGEGFDLLGDSIAKNAEVSLHTRLTAARGLARSWTVGVEHGGNPDSPSAAGVQDVRRSANLQTHDELLDLSGTLQADNILWGRWPRIRKAGVLLARIQHDGVGGFIVPLVSNNAAGFLVGDVVRLRTRPLPESTGHSGRFVVVAVAGDSVQVSLLPGTVVDPATFPPIGSANPGSILFAAARAPDPDPATGQYGADLMLMTDVVRQRINLTRNPLNAQPLAGEAVPPNDPVGRPCANLELDIPTEATNFPGRVVPFPGLFSGRVIGLYDNGGGHNCGVYRPTGMCIMSSRSRRAPAVWMHAFDFCLVCHYAMVDWVNPSQHFFVNADYRQRYEKKTRGGP